MVGINLRFLYFSYNQLYIILLKVININRFSILLNNGEDEYI